MVTLMITSQIDDGKEEEATQELQVTETTISDKPELTAYRVELPHPLAPGTSTIVDVVTVFTHAVIPHPREITQEEKQLVLVTSNAYVFLPYLCKTQSTTVLLPSSTIESFTRVAPVNTNDKEVTYGPYTDVPAYSHARIQLHYENNGPFVGVVSLERVIEVSHWGNVAVEEHYHLKHFGEEEYGLRLHVR